MKINRRDVLNVAFGSGTPENHLVIVLSPEEVNTEEESFLGIMITKSELYDIHNEYSFPLTNDMFTKPLKFPNSRVRLYLINFLPEGAVIGKISEMKIMYFKEMIQELNSKIFGL